MSTIRLTPQFFRSVADVEVAERADPGDSIAREQNAGLAPLGAKLDLDATMEAVSTLADVIAEQRNARRVRLPATLSPSQKHELFTFVVQTLADGSTSVSGEDVWHAIAPADREHVTGRLEGRVPRDAADRLLERCDETLDALAYFDRLRG